MRKLIASAAILLLMSAFQCERESIEPRSNENQSVTYGETQCADPWKRGATNAETLRNIEAFMQTNQIRFTGTDITTAETFLSSCTACQCASGRVIQGTVAKEDLTRIAQFGFK